VARKRKQRQPRRVPRIPVVLNQHASREPDAGKRTYTRKRKRWQEDAQ